MTREEHLLEGAKLLSAYLEPLGFKFIVVDKGRSSGGYYAHGQFVCEDRTIDLHFRYSLGLVSYQAGNLILSHTDFVNLVNQQGKNKYPNFSTVPIEAFHCLMYDLQHLLNDFTENNAIIFRQKAPEKIKEVEENQALRWNAEKRTSSGDERLLEQAKIEFKKGNYLLVDKIKMQIRHPELLTTTEIKMFQLNDSRMQRNR